MAASEDRQIEVGVPPLTTLSPAVTPADVERLQLALEAKHGLVWDTVIDPKLGPLHVTRIRPSRAIFGYAPEEIPDGADWWNERVHPEDRASALAALGAAITDRQPYAMMHYRFRRKDGTYAHLDDRVCISPLPDGTVRAVGCKIDVSPLVEAQNELSRERARYRALATLDTLGIWRADTTGNYLEVAANLMSALGLPPENALELRLREHVHPEDLDDLMRRREFSLTQGQPFESEHRLRVADGSHRWFRVRVAPVRNDRGEIIEWVGTHQDIHDRMTAAEALRRSEARYSTFVKTGALFVWTVGPDGKTTSLGGDFEELLGLSQEKCLDLGWLEVIHPEDREIARNGSLDAIARGEPFEIRYRIRFADGEYRWTVARAVPIHDGQGRIIEWSGATHDIHDHVVAQDQLLKRAEEAQRERHRLELILEAIPIPIQLVVQGRTDGPAYVNRAFSESMDELMGWRFTGDYAEAVRLTRVFDASGNEVIESQRPFHRATRGEEIAGEEVSYHGPGARRITFVRAVKLSVPFDGVQTMVVAYQDVTRLKRVEAELRSASEAKDRFLAVLSHELRTPLTPVLTAAQLLESDAGQAEEARQHLSVIRRNVELEIRLIDDLLDLTRVSRGKLRLDTKPLDLRQLLGQVVEICTPDLRGKGIHLELALGEQALPVTGDAARLQQVFWNLLKNSLKFTPEGGRIELNAQVTPGEVEVHLRDNGIGIPSELLPRVFDAFVQGDHDARRFGGLGLGLAIAQAIVKMHGGTLTVESAGQGRGARFTLRLPLGGPSADPGTPVPRLPGSAERSLRILLIEDHADSARLLKRLLQNFGHVVTTATTVATAVAAIRSSSFDLIISDISLPDGSGYDVMRETRDVRPPAIAISGFGMDEDLQRSREAGFLDHLTKPVDATLLHATIVRVTAVE